MILGFLIGQNINRDLDKKEKLISTFLRDFFLISYLAASRPILCHWRGDSINHSMLIIHCVCLTLFWVGFLDLGFFVFVFVFFGGGQNCLPSALTSDRENLESRNFVIIYNIVCAFRMYKKIFINISIVLITSPNIDSTTRCSCEIQ